MKRWDFSLENTECDICEGTGKFYEERDSHRSGGWAPCPRAYFNGHGYPSCVDGVLKFSQYDKDNWDWLKTEFTIEKENF